MDAGEAPQRQRTRGGPLLAAASQVPPGGGGGGGGGGGTWVAWAARDGVRIRVARHGCLAPSLRADTRALLPLDAQALALRSGGTGGAHVAAAGVALAQAQAQTLASDRGEARARAQPQRALRVARVGLDEAEGGCVCVHEWHAAPLPCTPRGVALSSRLAAEAGAATGVRATVVLAAVASSRGVDVFCTGGSGDGDCQRGQHGQRAARHQPLRHVHSMTEGRCGFEAVAFVGGGEGASGVQAAALMAAVGGHEVLLASVGPACGLAGARRLLLGGPQQLRALAVQPPDESQQAAGDGGRRRLRLIVTAEAPLVLSNPRAAAAVEEGGEARACAAPLDAGASGGDADGEDGGLATLHAPTMALDSPSVPSMLLLGSECGGGGVGGADAAAGGAGRLMTLSVEGVDAALQGRPCGLQDASLTERESVPLPMQLATADVLACAGPERVFVGSTAAAGAQGDGARLFAFEAQTLARAPAMDAATPAACERLVSVAGTAGGALMALTLARSTRLPDTASGEAAAAAAAAIAVGGFAPRTSAASARQRLHVLLPEAGAPADGTGAGYAARSTEATAVMSGLLASGRALAATAAALNTRTTEDSGSSVDAAGGGNDSETSTAADRGQSAVLSAIQALSCSMDARFDRVEAALQRQDRRLKALEAQQAASD